MRAKRMPPMAALRTVTTGLVLAGLLAIGAPVLGTGSSAGATEPLEAAGPARPFGSHPSPFPPGAIGAPQGSAAAADAATRSAYDHWKREYLTPGCGAGRFYVDASTGTDSMVVSEGQGYGMVITALMAGYDRDARAEFDGLFRYATDHPSSSDPDLVA